MKHWVLGLLGLGLVLAVGAVVLQGSAEQAAADHIPGCGRACHDPTVPPIRTPTTTPCDPARDIRCTEPTPVRRTPTATATQPTGTSQTVATVEPGTGGTLTSPDGAVQLTVPGEAISQTTTFTYTTLPPPTDLPAPDAVPLQSFSLTAQADGQPVSTFAAPLQLTMELDPDQLGSDPDSRVRLYARESAQEDWAGIPTAVDLAQNTATVLLDHFTEFVLVADAPATDPSLRYAFLPLVVRAQQAGW